VRLSQVFFFAFSPQWGGRSRLSALSVAPGRLSQVKRLSEFFMRESPLEVAKATGVRTQVSTFF
jgi:hypothetical protein